jgi:hypothetical protein
LSQGIFNVVQLADGTIQASRPQIGETMLSATGQKVSDQAVQMPLADMKSRISPTAAPGTGRAK